MIISTPTLYLTPMEASTKWATDEIAQRRNRHSEATMRCPGGRAPITAARRMSLVNLRPIVNARGLSGLATQQLLPWKRRKFSPNRAETRAPRAAARWAQATGPDPHQPLTSGSCRGAIFFTFVYHSAGIPCAIGFSRETLLVDCSTLGITPRESNEASFERRPSRVHRFRVRCQNTGWPAPTGASPPADDVRRFEAARVT